MYSYATQIILDALLSKLKLINYSIDSLLKSYNEKSSYSLDAKLFKYIFIDTATPTTSSLYSTPLNTLSDLFDITNTCISLYSTTNTESNLYTTTVSNSDMFTVSTSYEAAD